MSTTSLPEPTGQSIGTILTNALIAGVISAVINLLIFFIGGAVVGGIEVATTPGEPFAPLPFFIVVIASIVPTLLAGIGLWIAAGYIPNGIRVWQIVAVVITLLSLGSPFGGQVATIAAAVLLALMHVVVGGVMVWYLTLRQPLGK